jgi:hypothetical protein
MLTVKPEMMKIIGALAALSFAGLIAGCASTSYVYRPSVAAGPESGYTVAHYAVPPDSPRGDVYVSSFGVTTLHVAPNVDAPMLHVRLAVANNTGSGPWTADAREQRVTIAGGQAVGPTYANSDEGGPILIVGTGQRRMLDLYYGLPPGAGDARAVPAFDLNWKVDTGQRTIAQNTPFTRDVVPAGSASPAPPAFVAVGLGWGPGWWWYDPAWPSAPVVVGVRPTVIRYAAPPFVVGRPLWHGHAVAGWHAHHWR